jgi:hypothetical protein
MADRGDDAALAAARRAKQERAGAEKQAQAQRQKALDAAWDD